jgi:hypothetical protein
MDAAVLLAACFAEQIWADISTENAGSPSVLYPHFRYLGPLYSLSSMPNWIEFV